MSFAFVSLAFASLGLLASYLLVILLCGYDDFCTGHLCEAGTCLRNAIFSEDLNCKAEFLILLPKQTCFSSAEGYVVSEGRFPYVGLHT